MAKRRRDSAEMVVNLKKTAGYLAEMLEFDRVELAQQFCEIVLYSKSGLRSRRDNVGKRIVNLLRNPNIGRYHDFLGMMDEFTRYVLSLAQNPVVSRMLGVTLTDTKVEAFLEQKGEPPYVPGNAPMIQANMARVTYIFKDEYEAYLSGRQQTLLSGLEQVCFLGQGQSRAAARIFGQDVLEMIREFDDDKDLSDVCRVERLLVDQRESMQVRQWIDVSQPTYAKLSTISDLDTAMEVIVAQEGQRVGNISHFSPMLTAVEMARIRLKDARRLLYRGDDVLDRTELDELLSNLPRLGELENVRYKKVDPLFYQGRQTIEVGAIVQIIDFFVEHPSFAAVYDKNAAHVKKDLLRNFILNYAERDILLLLR